MQTKITLFLALSVTAAAQTPVAATIPQPLIATAAAITPALEELRSTYLLGPDDQITIHALDAEELNDKPVRIDMSGHIRLPLAGRIQASGLTVEQLEAAIAASLKKYINAPEVSVSVVESRSQPVSVIGSVKTPGVQQL